MSKGLDELITELTIATVNAKAQVLSTMSADRNSVKIEQLEKHLSDEAVKETFDQFRKLYFGE
ncbi:hypothetical protein HMPREF1013_00206 [Bacillus sp. 2_A_57_CT2]|nr:hypothetical protein HMPREF1013_00206 [Bacillus sp. 2_A_57_CT2]